MNKDVKAELNRLAKAIQNGKDISYGELAFLQDHQKEIYELGDTMLAEWAGIPESEWRLKNDLLEFCQYILDEWELDTRDIQDRAEKLVKKYGGAVAKRYRVVRDLQGGSFGMDRNFTAEEWLEQAVEWRDSDDSFENPSERSQFIKRWKQIIKEGKEQELIDYIADIWQLEFKEID